MSNVNYFAGHMKKLKESDLKWSQIHNQRERESRSNRDIDKSKTSQNYDLVNDGKINYQDRIGERLKEGLKKGARIRKDSVKCNSWIITSDKSFFEKIGEQEEKRFFKESYKWFCKRYGEENVVFATVHKDEHTPHMHLGITPITKDGRLSSKELFGPKQLKEIQDEFPRYMKVRGFELERGIPGKQKHVEPVKYKNKKVLDKAGELDKYLEDLVNVVEEIKVQDKRVDAIGVKEKYLFKKGWVEVKKEDWEYVKTRAKQAVIYKYELQRTRQDLHWTKERNEWLEKGQADAVKYRQLGELLGKDKLELVLEKHKPEMGKEEERGRIGSDLEKY